MKKILPILTIACFLGACAPRIEVAASDKPITINLNVKIQHEILIKIDKALDDIFSDDSELF
ncbi:YnbE family lipoprotein [Alteromonadaceae bacterium M269]|nr:YnbE family lipoprotein [Alteromonadaceae bacterium M269]